MEEEIIITYDLIDMFKHKYNLNNNELAGIFKESEFCFTHKKEEKIINNLKNPKYVYELIVNEDKLKERVKELYESNKNARKVYNKIFGNDSNILTSPCTREALLAFRVRHNISKENLAIILGIRVADIVLFEAGERNFFISKDINLNYYIENEEEFYKLVVNAFKDKKITKREFVLISNTFGREEYSKKKKTKYVIRTTRKSDIPKKDNEKSEKENRKDVEMEKIQKSSQTISKREMDERNDKKRKIIKIKRRVGELRSKAKREEEIEFDGGSMSCKVRKEFINRLHELLEMGEIICDEDIEIVKNAVMYNESATSVEGIKICVIGTLRNKGYRETIKVINELGSYLDKKKYGSALQEYKEIIKEKYEKMLEMKNKGERI